MRKIFVILFGVFALFSCQKRPLVDEPQLSDYTVIMLGVGGGDLDMSLYKAIADIGTARESKNVNFVGLFKFSKYLQDGTVDEVKIENDGNSGSKLVSIPSELRNTICVVKTAESDGVSQYAAADFEFNSASNLSKFFNEVAKEYTAKKYVLVLWNHGMSFNEKDLPLSRSVLLDDNLDGAVLSTFSLESAIKSSNIKKFDMIYADLCLMNTIETIYQLSGASTYFLGSSNAIPSEGGNYKLFLDLLSENADIEKAMGQYVPRIVQERWKNAKLFSQFEDMSLLDLRKIEPVVSSFGVCAKRYIELYRASDATLRGRLHKIQMSGSAETVASIPLMMMLEYSLPFEYIRYDDGGKFFYYDGQAGFPSYVIDGVVTLSDATIDGYVSTDLYSSLYALNVELGDKQLGEGLVKLKKAIEDMRVCSSSFGAPEFMESPALIGLDWVTASRFSGNLPLVGKKFNAANTLSSVYPRSAFDIATGWSKYFEIYDFAYPSYSVVPESEVGKYLMVVK